MKKEPIYKVSIKKIRGGFGDQTYKWEVEVYENHGNESQNWDLRGYGLTFRLKGAKKQALKYIMAISKDLDKGVQYGVIFELEGNKEAVTKGLQ